jgi:mono/diheme cytochrome c family protein
LPVLLVACGASKDPDVTPTASLVADRCSVCHGPPSAPTPGGAPLETSPWVRGAPEHLVAIVLHGVAAGFDTTGIRRGLAMPPFGNAVPMHDSTVATIVTAVRESAGVTDLVTPADVAQVRAATVGRTRGFTAAELHALAPLGAAGQGHPAAPSPAATASSPR